MRSCVSSACAIQVRASCVRCLDSLCHSWHTKNRSTLHIYGPKSVLISSKLADQASYFFFGEYWIILKMFLDNTCSVIGQICIRMPAMCPQFLQYFTYLSCLPLLTSGDRRRQQSLQILVDFMWIVYGNTCNNSENYVILSVYIDRNSKVLVKQWCASETRRSTVLCLFEVWRRQMQRFNVCVLFKSHVWFLYSLLLKSIALSAHSSYMYCVFKQMMSKRFTVL